MEIDPSFASASTKVTTALVTQESFHFMNYDPDKKALVYDLKIDDKNRERVRKNVNNYRTKFKVEDGAEETSKTKSNQPQKNNKR